MNIVFPQIINDLVQPFKTKSSPSPEALGQTCLNLFYYGALKIAREIYLVLNETAMADLQKVQAEKMHCAILENLHDPERKLFFEGLNTPTPEELGRVQIYFSYFLLEAVYRNDLSEEYTRKLLEQWKDPAESKAVEYAKIMIPSPFGMIKIDLQSGREPEIVIPEGIELL